MMEDLGRIITERTGIHLPDSRREQVAQVLRLGPKSGDMSWLTSSLLQSPEMQRVIDAITVPETYFFREPAAFEFLQKSIVPDIVQTHLTTGRRFKIWCAGCCTGEEPYSIAIALSRILGTLPERAVEIIGTDINNRYLKAGQVGTFAEWSFRNAPAWLRSGFFSEPAPRRFRIDDAIRRSVSFQFLNLNEPGYLQQVDLIFCRNVLIYFSAECAQRVLKHFHAALSAGGWLVLGATEANLAVAAGFESVSLPGAIFRKGGAVRKRPAPIHVEPAASPKARKPLVSEPAAAPSPEPAGTAWSLADEGRLGDALKWCDEAICNDKFNARLHYLRSTILEEMSELEQAIASLKHAIYLEERFVMAEFRLANLSKRVGRDGDARKFAANAIGLLETYDKNAVPENCEGMTAGRLAELIRPLLGVLESAKR